MAVCSSAEEGLMETLLGVHKNETDAGDATPPPAAGTTAPKTRRRKKRA
jgi:hypothetical protein